MPSQSSLPIDTYLPDALSKLKSCGQLVLEAEPGAGKTTRFPLALLEANLHGRFDHCGPTPADRGADGGSLPGRYPR